MSSDSAYRGSKFKEQSPQCSQEVQKVRYGCNIRGKRLPLGRSQLLFGSIVNAQQETTRVVDEQIDKILKE
jgi:hypothetical protein